MNERCATGMQADASVRIRAPRAIFQIALNGASYLSQLATNLMMPSGLEVNFQQIIIIGTCYYAIMQNSFFSAWTF